MARRSEHKRSELTTMAINAAERIIANDGLEQMSARRIAKEIGYAPGTLYNLFEDLDELVLRVNARTLDGLLRAFEEVPPCDTPRDALHALADSYLSFTSDNRRLWDALLTFRRNKPAPPPQWYLAHLGKLVGHVAEILTRFRPTLSEADRAYRARLIWASIHGISSVANAGSVARSLVTPVDRMVHDLVDIHCNSLEGR